MRVQLNDQSLLPDLLRFPRDSGCIAYYAREAATIEAIRPRAFGEHEEREIEELLDRWRGDHPHVAVTATAE